MTNDPYLASSSGESNSSATPRKGSFRGNKNAVAADHPIAASTGTHILHEGGSAADAAIAMSAVLTVVQPQMSHLGGDLFAMAFSPQDGSIALNSSGAAPSNTKIQEFKALKEIPESGVNSVTTPGCVAGWEALHTRFGKLPWPKLFEPAEQLAREGFPPSQALIRALIGGRKKVKPSKYFLSIFEQSFANNTQKVIQPELANTFRIIMRDGSSGFYDGEIAEHCLNRLNTNGQLFKKNDWQGDARWEKPLSTNFLGYKVLTQPPPSRGLVLLLALKKYDSLLKKKADSTVEEQLAMESFIYATKLVDSLAGDPDQTGFDAYQLITNEQQSTGTLQAGSDGGTTHLLAIDSSGLSISLIQSIFSSWGSGVFVPETGVLLNNRMRGFVLDENHPNMVSPNKRPMHTLHSYLVTDREDNLYALGGTPGAFRQPQTNLQILDGLIRLHKNPQDALDDPRWGIDPEKGLFIESRIPNILGEKLQFKESSTHYLESWDGWTGRASVARIYPNWLEVGCDLRGEGQAIID